MTRKEFLEKIIPIIQVENEKRGNPLFNSVVIAQACLETGFGNSELMMKANAPFGIKAGTNWNGKVYSAKTKEFYNGNEVNITDCFRAYDTLPQGVSDYFDLITKNERYRKACVSLTPEECIDEICKGGYATDPTYKDTIIMIIKGYKLEEDDIQIESNYIVGNVYTLLVNLNVRFEPDISCAIKRYDDLTEDGKKHCTNTELAVLKRGTRVTCKGIVKNGNNIWMKIPSGYVAALYKGKKYICE